VGTTHTEWKSMRKVPVQTRPNKANVDDQFS